MPKPQFDTDTAEERLRREGSHNPGRGQGALAVRPMSQDVHEKDAIGLGANHGQASQVACNAMRRGLNINLTGLMSLYHPGIGYRRDARIR